MESQPASEGFIPEHGGYETLLSYQKARIVYDGTVWFCERFLDPRSRTVDQMVQAARSGKQNIVEGSQVSGTSKEAELKLLNVARASLEELLEDYRDYLRTRGHALWDKNSNQALFVRKLGRKDQGSYEAYREFLETRPADVCTSILICLICSINCSGSLSEPFSKKAGCGNGCSAPARKRGRRNRSTTTTAARLSSTGRSGKF
jgi:four helix bundle protein